MAFIVALLIGMAVIAAFIAYWVVMATLIVIGMVFVFWAFVFAGVFGDPYVGSLCSIIATVITLLVYNEYSHS